MANIKRGLKRIERVLLVLGCLGILIGLVLGVDYKIVIGGTKYYNSFYDGRTSIVLWDGLSSYIGYNSNNLLAPTILFAPYLVYKFISWLVMGFLDEKE